MARYYTTVCIARILTFAVLVSLWASSSHAANSAVAPADKLQHFVDVGKLHHSIKKQIDQAGESEVLVVLDGTEANTMAEDTKKLLGVKQDSDDIVKEKGRLHKKKKDELLSSIHEGDYKVLKSYEHFPLIHIKINKAALEALLDMPGVALVSDNAVFTHKLTESLPLIGSTQINDTGVTGKGTTVAVLDTGVNYTLPAFGSCTAPGVPAGCKVAYFQDFTQRGGLDASGHGTNVAGIIVGVAPDTKIVALNVFRADGYAYETDVIEALDWVLANRTAYNISIVNLSLGTGKYTASCASLAVARVIDDLKRAGIVTVIPSGNDGFSSALSYPACSPAGVSVGAVYDSNMDSTLYWQEANCTESFPMGNQVACFSNSSPLLTILAPGAVITAGGTSMSGTSQAAGHVSGAVALLKGKDPLLTVDEIIAGLSSYGAQITDTKNGITKPMLILSTLVNNTKAGASADAAQSTSEGKPTTSDATTTGNSGGASSDSTLAKSGTKGTEGTSQVVNGQNANHQISGPGWLMLADSAISSKEAKAYFDSIAPLKTSKSGLVKFTTMSTTDATPEIAELARALRYDPKLIYDYIHNNIDYVPYYGSLKGATLTLLDGSGNDFDQASLMIALLRASGFPTAKYINGSMNISGSQLANWGGVDQAAIGALYPSGGIAPFEFQIDGSVTLNRVWVKATISGTDYLFDPAFKTYADTPKIDLPTALAYNQTNFMTGATTGAKFDTDYVQTLNEGNIRSTLTTYTNNLIKAIRTPQNANKSVEEIIGGRSIVQSNLTTYTSTLPFTTTNIQPWDEIPATHITTIRIQHQGIDCTINTPDLSGKRLTLTYPGTIPTLLLDGTPPVCTSPTGNPTSIGTSTITGNHYPFAMTIDHPYPGSDKTGRYGDQNNINYSPISGSTYSIVYNFGGTADLLIQKRQQQLDKYRSQPGSTTEEVLGETLTIMGQTWLKEVMLTNRLLGALADTVPIMHHNIGFMAQETTTGTTAKTYYYIDVKAAGQSSISKHNSNIDSNALFKSSCLVGSAFEHGVIEQLGVIDGLTGKTIPGISTMKAFQIANTIPTGKLFYAKNTNFTTGSNPIKPQLKNYDSNTLSALQSAIDQGFDLILPDNGQQQLGQWIGPSYIAKTSTSMKMIISSGLNGGTATQPATVNPETVAQNVTSANISASAPTTIRCQAETSFLPPPPSCSDPVDMASGAYFYDHTDLAVGAGAPLGLSFTRSYDSSFNLTKKTMGYGWTHNYDIDVTAISHADPVLGKRQPVDAASFIAALYVMLDLVKNQDNIQGWGTASLVSKWAVDQTIDNAVSARFGKKSMEFVKLPDGTYASPPGETTKLQKNGDGTNSLKGRFGESSDFTAIDPIKRTGSITRISDANGNPLDFIYSGGKLTTIRDAFSRTLTLGYNTDGLINSVTDDVNARNVKYGYTNGELNTYTDPELKNWGYGYEPSGSHRMTTMTNPLLITSVTNTYDALGRVKQQVLPRQTQQDGSTTATYDFFITGYSGSERDPSGNITTFYFDNKGRTVAEENPLGQRSLKKYDGQNHMVLNIDPRLNNTSFEYDSNQNLIKTTNALNVLNYQTTYQYDTQLRLSDIFDPMMHNKHFEYDAKHHPILTRDNLGNTTQASFNWAKGLKDTSKDGRTTQTLFTYDSYGNPQTSKTASHPVITYVYDPVGRMTDLTDQVGSKTSFEYDKRSMLKKITDPGRILTTGLDYYDDGKLWTKTDRKGDTITYTYTPSGKLWTKSYPNSTQVSLIYNKLDQLVSMQDTAGTTTYGYDLAGRLNSVTDAQTSTVGYLYDSAGNLKELTYPGNKKVIYTYDELNRIKAVTIDWLPAKPVATYTYKPKELDLLNTLVQFNGITTTYAFDTAHRLTGIDIPAVASYNFTDIDGNGNRRSITQTEPLIPTISAGTAFYDYNTQRNRLRNDTGISFGYDNEGQLSSGYGSAYTFDYEHRLIAMAGASFTYDGSANRLQATRNGVTTRYIYDVNGNLLAEADGSNTITRYYVYGAGLLAMVTPSGQVYNYHFNATGSTVAITDQSQAMVNKYAYDSFGAVTNQQEAVAQPFKFVGQFGVMTEPNGFNYMKARYYDPKVGRFVSEDPSGFGGGDVNLSAYVQNNPVNYIDPQGKLPVIPILIGGGTVIAGGWYLYESNETFRGVVDAVLDHLGPDPVVGKIGSVLMNPDTPRTVLNMKVNKFNTEQALLGNYSTLDVSQYNKDIPAGTKAYQNAVKARSCGR